MEDEVDRLIGDWARERAELEVTPMQVLSRLTRLAVLLDRLRKDAFASQDIVSWEFDVLAALRRSGAPYRLSPGQLIRSTLVTSGTMTNRVDRLAERGLVVRHADPSDRRGVLVELTERGRDVVDHALDVLLSRERELLDPLDEVEQHELAGLLRRLSHSLEN